MDILTNRQQKSYDYVSRYSNFPYYFNSADSKYIYGLTSQLSQDTTYVTISITHPTTLDELANKYYGRPDYFWIIADFNHIQDPFVDLYGNYSSLNLPGLNTIEYEK